MSPKTTQISTRAPQNKTKNNNLRDHKETQKFKERYSKIIGTWGEQHARANLGTAQKHIKEINFQTDSTDTKSAKASNNT